MPDHPFRLIVFDFDGTLVDSQAAIVQAMADGFAAAGLPTPEASAVRQVIGLKLEVAIRGLLPGGAEAGIERAIARGYRDAFFALRTRPNHHEPMFPQARETLASLDQGEVRLGIATGKARRGLLASLDRHGIGHHFVTLQTADDGPGKPHPAILRQAMREAGVEAEDTVMIGDTVFDIDMAVRAGVSALGVAWGYHAPHELSAAGAARIVDRFAGLSDALAAFGQEVA